MSVRVNNTVASSHKVLSVKNSDGECIFHDAYMVYHVLCCGLGTHTRTNVGLCVCSCLVVCCVLNTGTCVLFVLEDRMKNTYYF